MNPVEKCVLELMQRLDMPQNEQTAQTPMRVAALWQNLLSGHRRDPKEAFKNRMPSNQSGLICVTRLPYHSICPHHLTPSFGYVHIAYDPGDWIVGFGDLQELVSICSNRLILQEDLAQMIAQSLMEDLGAQGAFCQIEGQHFCMILQNHQNIESRVITQKALGTLAQRTASTPLFSNIQFQPCSESL